MKKNNKKLKTIKVVVAAATILGSTMASTQTANSFSWGGLWGSVRSAASSAVSGMRSCFSTIGKGLRNCLGCCVKSRSDISYSSQGSGKPTVGPPVPTREWIELNGPERLI